MIDKRNNVNPLKDKFNKIERKLNPDYEPAQERPELIESELSKPMDTSFIKVNAKQIKAHKKVLASLEKQLDKNRTDLKALIEVKDNNHYKLEKLAEAINETKVELGHTESSIQTLQNDRITDEARLGKLLSKKVELESEIADKKREKEIITSDYHNLLNTIYLKEGEMNHLGEELASVYVEIEKVEKEFAKESRNFKNLKDDYEKKTFYHQKAQVKHKGLVDEHQTLTRNIKATQREVEALNNEIYKLNGDNERLHHHVRDLEMELSNLGSKHDSTFKDVEILRDKKSAYVRRRDELIGTIKSLKAEHSKNILEVEVRTNEKINLEKEVNELLNNKTAIENKIFSQKATMQSLESSIYEFNREKTTLTDSIKVSKLHFGRYETEIVKLRKEAEGLKEQCNLLLSESERAKKDAKRSENRFVNAKQSKENWDEKHDLIVKSINEVKQKIKEDNDAIDNYVKEIESIKAALAVKEKDIQRYKSIHNNVETQVNDVRGQHEAVVTEYRKTLKERTSWKERVTQREEYVESVFAKIAELKESIYKTQEQIKQDEVTLNTLSNRLVSSKNEQDFLSKEHKAKQEAKLKLDKKINAINEDCKKYDLHLEAKKNEIAQLNEELKERREAASEVEDQKELVASAISGAKVEHGKVATEIEEISKNIRVKQQEVKQLEAEFERIYIVGSKLQKERNALRETFNNTVEEKSQFESKIEESKRLIHKMKVQAKELGEEKVYLATEMRRLAAEKVKMDNEISHLQTAVDARSLEVQGMRTSLKSEVGSNTTRKEKVRNLIARSEKLDKQIQAARSESFSERGSVSALEKELQDLQVKNTEMKAAYEKEVKVRTAIKSRVAAIKADIKRIENAFLSEKNKTFRVKQENEALSSEYKKLQSKKEQMLDEIELKASFSDQPSEAKGTDVFTSAKELEQGIAQKFKSSKNSSVMMTVVKELIAAISENEFSDLKWAAKFADNATHDAVKIRFKNMQTQYTEVKSTLKPLIQNFAEKFKSYGINIQTRTKTSPGEVIEAIEFRVTLAKPTRLEAGIQL